MTNSYCTGFNKDFSSVVNISSNGRQFSEQYSVLKWALVDVTDIPFSNNSVRNS